ncbi:hypothetical protein BNJ_00114 [Kaumoebavirus]|uniref:hypothetical protein n=1 Tax=Kaumoebavirus TaxID=1859492 RepID=UPI0009C22E30|nr:hypothetical protein BNJ_00114 [Kaumoebavirus]ARA71949.1 hypothetical protein BNJ_00114 [Kaumoebavirus]
MSSNPSAQQRIANVTTIYAGLAKQIQETTKTNPKIMEEMLKMNQNGLEMAIKAITDSEKAGLYSESEQPTQPPKAELPIYVDDSRRTRPRKQYEYDYDYDYDYQMRSSVRRLRN